KNLPTVKLIFLTTIGDLDVAAEAFRRGASGYLLKTCTSEELPRAVRAVIRGNKHLSATLPRDTINYLQHCRKHVWKKEDRLTQRQREVLTLLVEGKHMKEIGALLHLTLRTVAFHKYRLMEVLDAKSNADLIRYAVRNHIAAA